MIDMEQEMRLPNLKGASPETLRLVAEAVRDAMHGIDVQELGAKVEIELAAVRAGGVPAPLGGAPEFARLAEALRYLLMVGRDARLAGALHTLEGRFMRDGARRCVKLDYLLAVSRGPIRLPGEFMTRGALEALHWVCQRILVHVKRAVSGRKLPPPEPLEVLDPDADREAWLHGRMTEVRERLPQSGRKKPRTPEDLAWDDRRLLLAISEGTEFKKIRIEKRSLSYLQKRRAELGRWGLLVQRQGVLTAKGQDWVEQLAGAAESAAGGRATGKGLAYVQESDPLRARRAGPRSESEQAERSERSRRDER